LLTFVRATIPNACRLIQRRDVDLDIEQRTDALRWRGRDVTAFFVFAWINSAVQSMDLFVARLNIQHFRKLLIEETDEAKREAIIKLLVAEERVLAALESAILDPKTK
jgi:hypothetical protein